MDVLKIIGIALSGVLLSVVLKQYRGEYQVLIALSCGVIIFILSLKYLTGIFSDLSSIVSGAGINSGYFSLMLKAVGIAALCEIGVNLCRDAGESAIASNLEFAAKLTLIFLSLPVFTEVISVLSQLLV